MRVLAGRGNSAFPAGVRELRSVAPRKREFSGVLPPRRQRRGDLLRRKGAGGPVPFSRHESSPGSSITPGRQSLEQDDPRPGLSGGQPLAHDPSRPARHASRRCLARIASSGSRQGTQRLPVLVPWPVSVLWVTVVLTVALRRVSTEACPAELRRNEPPRRFIGIESEAGVPSKWNVSRFEETLGDEPHRLARLRQGGGFERLASIARCSRDSCARADAIAVAVRAGTEAAPIFFDSARGRLGAGQTRTSR